MYAIYNEDGEKMRVVQRKEEAEQLVATRTDWTFKFFKLDKKPATAYQFEEAPF
jgi:hypothetical protein